MQPESTVGQTESPYAALRDLVARAHVVVACDFDGCLAPIAEAPQLVHADRRSLSALDRLAHASWTTAAVVSGRSLADLRLHCDVDPAVILVGGHGAEFAAEGAVVSDTERAALTAVRAEVARRCSGIPGVLTEEKPASVAVHVRGVPHDLAMSLLGELTSIPAHIPGVVMITGLAVVEFLVTKATKGTALQRIRQDHPEAGVVYIGDDVTDEHAFAVLEPSDVGIKVGATPTIARYRVAHQSDVRLVLTWLADNRR